MLVESTSSENAWRQVKKGDNLGETFGGSCNGRLEICLLQTCSFKACLKPELLIWMRTVNSRPLAWRRLDRPVCCGLETALLWKLPWALGADEECGLVAWAINCPRLWPFCMWCLIVPFPSCLFCCTCLNNQNWRYTSMEASVTAN